MINVQIFKFESGLVEAANLNSGQISIKDQVPVNLSLILLELKCVSCNFLDK